ncbi:RNA polymerase sigma factor [Peristeroidobacter soli]|jgi:RNA polymerase sigma-70 factor (ECF subfamily)|uniref:RNA polymerase sigma factor n=1 Tax=Peristeroidobacter soli TaxID=2497877 RepID=UPI00101BCA4D|nr:sigma-70 family RNA polymerase sigma factor [Peristeroidobacter soli]
MKSPPSNPGPDPPSFAAEVQKLYGADLFFFLLSRLRNEQDAKDVAQEIYLRLLRLGQGELVRDPHAYVYFVASQVLAQFRMRARHSPLIYDSTLPKDRVRPPTDIGRDGAADRWMALAEIEELLSELPQMHRKVFLMRKIDELSWAQIAERLSISVHTVKKYLCEANARISVSRREKE